MAVDSLGKEGDTRDFGTGFGGYKIVRAEDLTDGERRGLDVDAGGAFAGVGATEPYEPLTDLPSQPPVTAEQLRAAGLEANSSPDYRTGVNSPYVITNE